MHKLLIHHCITPVIKMMTLIIRKRKNTSAINLMLFFIFFSTISVRADEWRGWRGLEKQAFGDSIEGPVEWTSTYNVLWKVKIDGEGHSSPVVSEENVFVTAANFDDSKMNFHAISVNVLFILLLVYILVNFRLLLKNLLINRVLSRNKFISELVLFSFYGFIIFIFCILHWMHFDENRTQTERILINYLISGAVFFLILLFLIIRFPKKSMIRVITGSISIILVVLFVKFLPVQDYYTTSDFFQLWSFQLIIPSIILPIFLSLYLILKTLIIRYKPNVKLNHNLEISHAKSFSSQFVIFSSITAFLFGISGYMVVPIITAGKLFCNDKLSRIQESLKFISFINPDFAYPFFLGVLSLGFLFWFIIENKKYEDSIKNKFYFYPVLLCCSSVFFMINNFGIRNPEYKREIICIDRYSGVIKWKRDCLAGPATCNSIHNSQATPTPLICESSVYTYFGSAGFVAMDFNGNKLWENTDLPFESVHGIGASPILSHFGITILNSMSENPYLTSLDFKTGKQQWKTELKNPERSGGEYRTPLLVDHNGHELIFEWSFSRNELVLYEAKTGEVMYMYHPDWIYGGESIVTPVFDSGILYLSNFMSVVAFDINKMIDGKSPILWATELKSRGPDTSSPVLGYGLLLMVSDNGFVTCINSKTGVIQWQEKLPGTYFSSPIITGKKVYFSNTAGMTSVIDCSSQFKRIMENQLPEGIYSTLVPVDGQLFIRTKNTLWCLK